MRLPPTRLVCSKIFCGCLILIAGCANPSFQTLNSLTVVATPSTINVGGAAALKAKVHLSDGSTRDVTSGTQWTVSNGSLATIGGGLLTGKSPGIVTVQAVYASATGQSSPTWSSTSPSLSSSAQVTIGAAPAGASTTAPLITWNTPAAIQYGTALSSVQLDATANVPGTFAYTMTAGTVLKAGAQTLSAVFTPADTKTYSAATVSVQLTVTKALPIVTWLPAPAITQGTALSGAQLNAVANVPGTLVYNPAAGTVLPSGTRPLTVTFTPADAGNYTSATATNSLTVGAAPTATATTAPLIIWNTPAAIRYGTALSRTQLDATANAPGTFAYTPAAGTVLKAGTQTLSVSFTPTNTGAFSKTNAIVLITVTKATSVVT